MDCRPTTVAQHDVGAGSSNFSRVAIMDILPSDMDFPPIYSIIDSAIGPKLHGHRSEIYRSEICSVRIKKEGVRIRQ